MLVGFPSLILAARAGNVVSFPTDTVPALAVQPEYGAKIYHCKQRPPDKPLILMAADLQAFTPWIAPGLTIPWEILAKQYWPGALTMVLPANARVTTGINPQKTGTIGLRIPHHPSTLSVLQQTGVLATTSANYSGELPLMTAAEINETFPDVYVLNGVYHGSGQPSTVIIWQDKNWRILRQGSGRFNPGDVL
ncbi:SUA5/yciO/yrdC domain-containing protein [Gloeomargarita lithophora Alchichica-D10]|uniref:L-threonylcarbamoyladenylate synthase n=1 Tax=Gloeomargarita lithophora Alchichica-D10 TaxID=1188229 RepID=A0A1J0AGJ2_9CYAN|nr:L-threonylcarbamoyladenylate synthase [Gloeomargarita lithophora]APB35065.1 SUA5/yciO/yrdC domain-containing protein [Gloeomargarita lithophora Alchichica-D10]